MGKKKKISDKLIFKGKIIPEKTLGIAAIAILLVLSLTYFTPFLSGSKMIAGSDWLLGAPNTTWEASYIKSHQRVPMWRPHFFGGLPRIAAPSGGPFGITPLLRLFLPTHIVFTYGFVIFLFLAGLGTYLYLRELKVSIYIALLGGMIYMFAGNLISTPYGGHLSRTAAAALFPLSLLFLHKGLSRKRLLYFLFAGGLVGFSFHETHFQMVYYSLILAAFYVLFWLIWYRKENGWRESLKLVLFSGLGILLMVGLVAVLWLPVYAGLSTGGRGVTKGYEYATSWSMPTAELLDLLVPDFSGILSRYWGENYFKLHTEYMGILPLILCLLAIAYKRKWKYVKFFTVSAVVTIIFALGRHTPFYKIPYYLLPGIKKFRGPSMIFYLTAFSVAVLAAIGVQALVDRSLAQKTAGKQMSEVQSQKIRNLLIGLGVLFGVIVIFALIFTLGKNSMLSFLESHFQPVLNQQRLNNMSQNYPYFLQGLGKLVFLLLVNSCLIVLLAAKRLNLGVWVLIAIPVFLFDTWIVEKQFLPSIPSPKEYYAADDVIGFLQKDKGYYRVFPLHYEHAQDSYFALYDIHSAGGYVSNPLQRYQDLIGAGESVMFSAPNLIQYRQFLDLLNIKYIISAPLPDDITQYDEKTQETIKYWKTYFGQFKLTYSGRHAIYENESYLPRAFLVPNFEVHPKEEVLGRMARSDFNPHETVILEEFPQMQPAEIAGDPGVVVIKSYDANSIVCEVNLASPGFLVLSENWHPDWKAYVGGEKTKVYVADYTLRAVGLKAGKHTVEFVYESLPFKIGALISFLSFLFLLGTIGFWFKTQIFKRAKR